MLDLIKMQSVVKAWKYLPSPIEKYYIQLRYFLRIVLDLPRHISMDIVFSYMPTTKYGSSHLEKKMFLLLFCYSLFSVAGSSLKRGQIAKDCEEMKDDFSENSGGLLQIARDLILD